MNVFSRKEQISIAPLVIFRILFGLLTFFGTIRFMAKGWVYDLYISPDFYFGFYGFEWVKPFPSDWMYLPFILMLIGSFGIILGLFYRFSITLFFLSFTYVELLDKTNYLNHYYFVSLIAFLLIWLPAQRDFSLDIAWRKKPAQQLIPKFNIQILQFQLACVYVFAGIAKINSDWLLAAEPLSTWLQSHRDLPLFGEILSQKWVAYLFSWFGCFYDLFIVFFLLMNKTRPFAYFFVVVFHLLTAYLFPIGVFPYVMITLTLVFFSVNFHQGILDYLKKKLNYTSNASEIGKKSLKQIQTLYFVFVFYIFIQIIVPFRYILYPGELFWNEEGFRFSWRVMLMHKEGFAQFYIQDSKTGGEIEVSNKDYLTKRQEEQMSTQPDMIIQFAQHLQNIYDGKEVFINGQSFVIEDPKVSADVYVSLNGRPSQKMISKEVNLTQKPYNLAHRDWLEEFKN